MAIKVTQVNNKINPTLVTRLVWCLTCERVSWSGQFDGAWAACPYSDCPFYADVATLGIIRGALWSHIQERYHPEYPISPRQGVRYPAPEMDNYVREKEQDNPFLKARQPAT